MTIRLVSISILLYFFFLTNLIKANPQDSITVSTNRIGRIDSLLKTIDKLHDRANEIETLSEKGFNLAEIKSGLPQIVAELKTLKLNLGASAQVLDLKSLQAFATMLDQSHQQLNTWRNVLLGYNQQLVNMQAEIEGLHENKLLISFKSDQLFISLYTKELNAIETSWNKAKIFTGKNLHDISDLQATVNTNYYLTRDLQKELDLQIRDYSVRIIGAEYPLIWKSYDTNVDREALNLINSSVVSQEKLIIQYFRENIAYQLLLTTSLLALFIYWVKKNQSKLLSEGKRKEWEGFLKGGAISSFALLPGLIIVFNLAPFFDLNPPQAYILLLQLLLFVVVSIFIFRHWPKKDKLYWLKIGISFFVFIAINAVSNPGSLLRFALLALNAFLAYNALYFVRKKGVELELSRFAKQVSIIFLLLNIVAIVLNITGRVTLAKVLTNAAIFGFIQIIALSMFTNIIKTAFLLQVHTASIINNGSSLINYEKLNTSVSKVLSIIVVILWIVVFTSNLNIYNAIVEGLGEFLFQVRTVGSTSFTIGNILLFFLVIYLSSLAQKYVGYIFGENQEHSVPGERKGSKVVIAKLIIILVGFLVAILVSGLPVDKITVILGAFGVGIGLGLQTIVNNFVSGIILIFERPLQVGDYVEVSGFKGWVNDIGIRATKLSSSEGAEILVPNGTILSGNLVNWTLNNSQIRVELNLKIAPQDKLSEAKEIIIKVLDEEEEVVKIHKPEIFNLSVNGDASEIKVWFWIDNIAREQMIRSNVISKLYTIFESKDIKLL